MNELANEPIETTLGRQQLRRRRSALPVAAGLLLLLAGAAVAYVAWSRHDGDARITAVGSRLVAGEDDGGTVSSVERLAEPEVVFHVTLADVPQGRRLPLHCVWTDAKGAVAHTNDYETKPVHGAHWTTHCRCRIGAAAAPGTWSVAMSLADRRLAKASFEVE